MGVVYRARQTSLNRVVALKMILSGGFASDDETKRFRLEAELAANLDHPNIVPIYEVGEHEGHHFFSMKLVEGTNLARQVGRLADQPRAVAGIVATVARAVDHAHGHGFLHCDLKPSNILIDREGRPHVTDFGLARRVEENSALTATGAILGTPSYMAPEQASGERRQLTPAADVYGLGAIFYELLTGRPPFRAATVMETVVMVLEREPEPPARVNRAVPSDLESICLRCLEKSPADRYPSAAELAEALDQYLRGEDVVGTGLAARLRRWTRREPELVSRLGGLSIVAPADPGTTTEAGGRDGIPQHQDPPERDRRAGPLGAVVGPLPVLAPPRPLARAGALRLGRDRRARTLTLVSEDPRRVRRLRPGRSAFHPLLIAASGLWFRVRLVWFTTALAIVAYGLLYLDKAATRPVWQPSQYPNIFMAALGVTGFIVVRQVKRIWALSAYYESRPGEALSLDW